MPVEKREKPILFNTEMVKAILEGRKIQTRRIVKFPDWEPFGYLGKEDDFHYSWNFGTPCGNYPGQIKCPWLVGQELWVRETFSVVVDRGCKYNVFYKEDSSRQYHPITDEICIGKIEKWKRGVDVFNHSNRNLYGENGFSHTIYNMPSIFMLKPLSRIQLRIKNIRVERVQNISVEDCLKEGIEPSISGMNIVYAFHDLWDSINANRKDKDGNILPYSWKCNPYVWALDFERIK